MRTYQCLHDSIRRCSPIGTLQALRINGTITPTVEKDMLISFDDAFRIVYDYAEPVSYTHLDVYKRQVRVDVNTAKYWLMSRSRPDVYKRQVSDNLVLKNQHVY